VNYQIPINLKRNRFLFAYSIKEKKKMNKKIAMFVSILVLVLALSAFSAIVSAANQSINGKGAVAVWHIQNTGSNPPSYTDVYAVLLESNSGKDGVLYIQAHGQPVTAIPMNFVWDMNHITVSATLTFFGQTHTVDLSWQALPKSQGSAPNSIQGMNINLDGSWKAATATLAFEANHPGGTSFPSTGAYIVHGDATITWP
jgi:hypothetical protein